MATLIGVLFSAASTSIAQQPKPWEQMDYGPFLTASVTMPGTTPQAAADPRNVTLKGISVGLGGRDENGYARASVCFDTDLLRYSAGWTVGWLKLMGTPFDGAHGPPIASRPMVDGNVMFTTSSRPGWAMEGALFDPREQPYGPLPRSWAHYNGLYLHGDRVVFSYTVGETDVLDSPGVRTAAGISAVTRTLRIGPSRVAQTILVCDDTTPGEKKVADDVATFGNVTVVLVNSAQSKAKLEIAEGSQLLLHVPPSDAPRVYELAHVFTRQAHGDVIDVLTKSQPQDPSQFTRGGPARWPQVITTQGKLGQPDPEEPYAIDSLTLPTDNPWKAWMRPSAFDFFPDGRAAVATWSGDVWIVSGIDDSLSSLKWKRFATGLYQPLGLKVVEGVVHTLGRDQITKLHDLNADGEADFYENFNNDCKVTPNFHEFACDLVTDAEGNFYYAKGAPLLGGLAWDPKSSHSGSILKVSKDGRRLERFATGLRACNGLGMMPPSLAANVPGGAGASPLLTAADNEGLWVPAANIHIVQRGEFLGAVGMSHRTPEPTAYDPPLCWLPKALDNSSASQVWVDSDRWGPFNGRMLHLSYGRSRLFHVLMEEVGGVMQGGVVRFKRTFDTGVMRGAFHPGDGQLYLAGLRGWQTRGVDDGGFYRMRYTGGPVHTIESVQTLPNGMALTFTHPLDKAAATDDQNWFVQQWNYKWSKDYGSPEYSVQTPRRIGRDLVEIDSITLSPDGRTVTLKMPQIQPVMQMAIVFNIKAADGTGVNRELFYTIHRVP